MKAKTVFDTEKINPRTNNYYFALAAVISGAGVGLSVAPFDDMF